MGFRKARRKARPRRTHVRIVSLLQLVESRSSLALQTSQNLAILPAWHAAECAVTGPAHMRSDPPTPCQDAARTALGRHPLAVVADGAGSAPVSHAGAAAAADATRRLVESLEPLLCAALDTDHPSIAPHLLASLIVRHARGTVADLARSEARPIADYRCTLLVWVVGQSRALWVKVGDGILLAGRNGAYLCIGPDGRGEFANQTHFIDSTDDRTGWAWGTEEAPGVDTFVAMSDGAAERLVSTDRSRVAPALHKLGRLLAETGYARDEARSLLSQIQLWHGCSGDDRSLALLARPPSV